MIKDQTHLINKKGTNKNKQSALNQNFNKRNK